MEAIMLRRTLKASSARPAQTPLVGCADDASRLISNTVALRFRPALVYNPPRRGEISMAFNGLGLHLGNLSRLSDAESRSLSPENPTGERGKGAMAIPDPTTSPARDLGQGWKVSPYIIIRQGETATLADIAGPGAI